MNPLRGFWKLTWVEMKIFVREPMGLIGTLFIPVALFLILGTLFGQVDLGATAMDQPLPDAPQFNVAVLAVLFIAISAVLSLIAIISIYREGGILKRLRATPLSPLTILGSHVVVKLVFTIVGLVLLVAVGKQMVPGGLDINLFSFALALLVSTLSILSIGFVIASIVPTARFAQPIGSAVLYPMVVISGLFFSLDVLPRGLRWFANMLPTTHAAALLEGVWNGAGWMPHLPNVAGLALIFIACCTLSARVFRWE